MKLLHNVCGDHTPAPLLTWRRNTVRNRICKCNFFDWTLANWFSERPKQQHPGGERLYRNEHEGLMELSGHLNPGRFHSDSAS